MLWYRQNGSTGKKTTVLSASKQTFSPAFHYVRAFINHNYRPYFGHSFHCVSVPLLWAKAFYYALCTTMAIAVAALMVDGTTKQTTRQWKYGRRLQFTVVYNHLMGVWKKKSKLSSHKYASCFSVWKIPSGKAEKHKRTRC